MNQNAIPSVRSYPQGLYNHPNDANMTWLPTLQRQVLPATTTRKNKQAAEAQSPVIGPCCLTAPDQPPLQTSLVSVPEEWPQDYTRCVQGTLLNTYGQGQPVFIAQEACYRCSYRDPSPLSCELMCEAKLERPKCAALLCS